MDDETCFENLGLDDTRNDEYSNLNMLTGEYSEFIATNLVLLSPIRLISFIFHYRSILYVAFLVYYLSSVRQKNLYRLWNAFQYDASFVMKGLVLFILSGFAGLVLVCFSIR